MTRAADKLASMIGGAQAQSQPEDHYATVTRVSGGTVYVRIDGSDVETPVVEAVSSKLGDRVTVRIVDRSARLTGNVTAPPTDDTVANEANGAAQDAKSDASEAKSTAKAASDALAEHRRKFYTDDHGAYIREETAEDGETVWKKVVSVTGDGVKVGADDGVHSETTADGYGVYDSDGNAIFKTDVHDQASLPGDNQGGAYVKLPSLADYKANGGASAATYVAADISVKGAKSGGSIQLILVRDDVPLTTSPSTTFTKGTAATFVVEDGVLAAAYDGEDTVTVQAVNGVLAAVIYDRPDTWASVDVNGTISASRTVNADEGFTVNGRPYCPFPVGSIYLTMQQMSSPSIIWPGTAWEQIECGRFLVSASGRTDGDTAKDTSANEGNAGWYPIGEKGGERRHTLSVAEMPAHNHGSAGAHTHRAGYKRPDAYGSGKVDGQHWTDQNKGEVTTSSNGAHTHSTEGGGGSHENRPPYLAVAMWKRTA